jgi:hypothetical protein
MDFHCILKILFKKIKFFSILKNIFYIFLYRFDVKIKFLKIKKYYKK